MYGILFAARREKHALDRYVIFFNYTNKLKYIIDSTIKNPWDLIHNMKLAIGL